ncbi:hypothetical protein [Streptomyces sp. NPDC051214]|uniref:hypothetical protein n=1 Tax=Streptomyces sp. NPDC051214 TaxID=3155282 RepID=UPI00343B7CE1
MPGAGQRMPSYWPFTLPRLEVAAFCGMELSAQSLVVSHCRTGFRIGELCDLHLADLHLREDAACGECRAPQAHVCHRDGLITDARAKTKWPWEFDNQVVRGGLIKRVSPAMIHAYFDYMTTEYPRGAAHGILLVQQHGHNRGLPWAPEGARKMLQRAGARAGLGLIRTGPGPDMNCGRPVPGPVPVCDPSEPRRGSARCTIDNCTMRT